MKAALRLAGGASLLLLTFVVGAGAGKDPEWTEGRSAHFHVISNAKPKQVQAIVQKLEEFRSLLGTMLPGLRLDPPLPTTVLLFKNEKTLRPYKPLTTKGHPKDVAGFFQPGYERMFLVVDLSAPQGRQVAFHEYMHLLLSMNLEKIPLWLGEGLAMFYETAELDGARFRLGLPQEDYWGWLEPSHLLPLEVLVNADQKSEYYQEGEKRQLFYGQSWLLVHYLLTNQKFREEAKSSQFVNDLRRGVPQDAAFQKAFGMDYKLMRRKLGDYLGEPLVTIFEGRLKEAPATVSQDWQPMESVQAEAHLVDLWINSGRLVEAEKALQKLAQAGSSPEALFRLGRIALARRQPQQAEEQFRAALAERPDDVTLRYYAALATSLGRLQEMGDGAESHTVATQIIEDLSPILERKTDFPGAYELLLQARMRRGDLPEEMIPMLERMRELLPQRRDFDLMLAHSYLNAARHDDAEKLLEEIVRSSAPEQDILQAKQWLERLQTMRNWRARGPEVAPAGEPEEEESEEASAPEPTTRPRRTAEPVEPPPTAPVAAPKVDFVQGRLQGVVCVGDGAVLTVQPDPKEKKPQEPIVLRVKSLSRLLVIDPGDTGQKLACGMIGVAVAINYRVESGDPEVAGVVMTLEFSRRKI